MNDVFIVKLGMNECRLPSTINTSVCQYLSTTYCVHSTTGDIFKTLTLKNKVAYKFQPCNNVYFIFINLLKTKSILSSYSTKKD